MIISGEPTVEELLNDPLTELMMACDGYDAGAIKPLLEQTIRTRESETA